MREMLLRCALRPSLLAALALVAVLIAPAVSRAGTANAGLPGAAPANPLRGMTWGTFTHPSINPQIDAPSAYFHRAGSPDRSLFAQILGVPRFRWFGGWIPLHGNPRISKLGIAASVHDYVDKVTGGSPDVGVQMATFRLQPWEGSAYSQLPTARQYHDCKRWIAAMAGAIGDRTRVAMVIQPDSPFALKTRGHSPWALQLMSYTARTFNRLAHTTVYIDAGAADWLAPRNAARLLERGGIRWARGFALNLTHFDSDAREAAYARQVIRILRRHGIHDKHAIINTAQNGRPFMSFKHRRAFHSGRVCTSFMQRNCVALGRTPSTQTGSSAIDAYLWIGRPWWNNARLRPYRQVLNLARFSAAMHAARAAGGR